MKSSHLNLTFALVLAVVVAGCEGGIYTDGDCADGKCDGTNPGTGSPITGPTSPGTAKLPSCNDDAQCVAPYTCNTKVGKCVPPSAKDSGPCDPIEGNNCPSGQQCISGVCMPPPGACGTNDDCPIGYLCLSGVCTPDGGPGSGGKPGCAKNADCPAGQICLSGVCKSQEVCNIPHAADRMAGTWKLDSTLHVRDGLEGITAGLLSVGTFMQNVIDGKFAISGIPSFLTDLIGPILQKLIVDYVPTWGKQVISLLADIDAVIQDWRVISKESISALGNDMYWGTSTWLQVEFTYKGTKVSTTPDKIPGLGVVTTEPYSAREVCGILYLDKHKVKNAIGKIFRWAVEAALTAVTCLQGGGVPCYTDLKTMFNDVIDCPAFAKAVQAAYPSTSGLEATVLAACIAQKATLTTMLLDALDDLSTKMTYMSLGAKADIASASQLINGKWYGVLGGSYGKGNFEGIFTGVRQ